VAAAARAFDASLVVCDVTGVGDPVTEQLQNELRDIPVDGFHFTRASKPALIENLVWIIERARIRLTSDPELLRELENFQALPTETGISYGAAGGFHDDLVCALALACWGLSRCATAIKSAQRKGGLSL
jgi:hypothetical protein